MAANLRVTKIYVETLREAQAPGLRVTKVYVEVLREEEDLSVQVQDTYSETYTDGVESLGGGNVGSMYLIF